MRTLVKVVTFALIAYFAFSAGLYVAHKANEYHARQLAEYEARRDALQAEADAMLEAFMDPETRQALEQLKASEERREKSRIENALQRPPGKDCWTHGSPQKQIDRIMEILGTPNEPDKGLQ